MRRVALLVLDGWGDGPAGPFNAVRTARTPRLDALRDRYPTTTLAASGLAVGLPEGQMGNSEVGHLNLGAGRVVYQDLTRINLALQDGSFYRNPVLLEACRRARDGGAALHLLGLLSDGGVHSHQEQLYALLELARREGVAPVLVHAFLDGRDTPPQSALGYLQQLEGRLQAAGGARVASLCGRYYAMDRDQRWERVERAFRALCRGEGEPAESAEQALRAAYRAGESDEFVVPRVVLDGQGRATPVRDGDVVVFFNFRADRARELTRAFTEPDFAAFDAAYRPHLGGYVTFTEYDERFALPVAFPPQRLINLYGGVVAAAGLRQLRVAETEKYAHVTFFFNGGEEEPFAGEDRVLVPSPRDVATYDEKPEMSAPAVCERLVAAARGGGYDVIVANFANLDMVGHTGVLAAAVAAAEVVDRCVGEAVDALLAAGYAVLVTADHGNAEQMRSAETGLSHTAHTRNRVPLVLVDPERREAPLRGDGCLADVAPTLLEIQGLPVPGEMSGRSLLVP